MNHDYIRIECIEYKFSKFHVKMTVEKYCDEHSKHLEDNI